MCDNCEKDLEVQETEELKELSLEDLQDLVNQEAQEEVMPIFQMSLEDYDMEEFQKGVKDASWTAGFYTALKNAGMYAADIVNILVNRETIDHNIRVNEITSKMNIEMSKNQLINLEKNQL